MAAKPRRRLAKAARPPPGARAAKRAETREQIRRAAWELFTKDGFDATTTQAIAKRAGVAAGTVFVHASDKADLLFLVMHDRLSDVVEDRLGSLPDGPLLDRLMHVFSGLFRMYAETPDVAAAFVRHFPGAKGPNAQRMTTLTFGFLHRLGMLVADAQEEGEVSRDVDAIVAVQNIFALYFAALMTWLSGYAKIETDLVPMLRSSLALLIRGLRA